MCSARLQFEQELLVKGVNFRNADVVSGEGSDRLNGLPEGVHEEMCGIALDTAQCVSAVVAESRDPGSQPFASGSDIRRLWRPGLRHARFA